MTHRFPFRFILVPLCLWLISCSEYEFKLNEQPLYTPKPLFNKFHLEDVALKECVRQTILDKRIREASELQLLVCTNAGITSLAGLAVFDKMEQLNLAHNLITDVEPLSRLAELRRLDLSNNGVKSVEPLMTLAHLKQVNLNGNPALDCGGARRLKEITAGAEVDLPEHCQRQGNKG